MLGPIPRLFDAALEFLVEARDLRWLAGDSAQCLRDHVFSPDLCPEQLRRHTRDIDVALSSGAFSGQRGRSADALDLFGAGRLADAAHQHRHIRALAAPVGVELVQHQETHLRHRLDEVAVDVSGQDVLGHHIVGQQDVRRVLTKPLALVLVLLAGEQRERHRLLPRRPVSGLGPVVEELGQLLALAVGQGVHRVQDQRLDAFAGAGSQHMVHDRHDVGQALARTRARGQHVASPPSRRVDRLGLVTMQRHRLAHRVLLRLAGAEDRTRQRIQTPSLHQLVNGRARLERRVQPHTRMRPQQPTRERSLHLGADALIRDLNEALEVSLMLRLELVPQSEHIHEHTYLPAASSRRHCWAAPATTIAHLLSPPRAVAQDNPAAPLRRTPPEAPTEPTDRLIRYWMVSAHGRIFGHPQALVVDVAQQHYPLHSRIGYCGVVVPGALGTELEQLQELVVAR